MSSPATPPNQELQIIYEEPGNDWDDGNPGSQNDSDSETSSNSEDEEEEEGEKQPEVSLKDLLDNVLTAIREGTKDLSDNDQLDDFKINEGPHLAMKKGSKGQTALHLLAELPNKELEPLKPLVDFLVQRQENLLTVQNLAGGYTPLYLAIFEKKERLVEWMCLAHKDVDSVLCIPSHEGKNCLHVAIEQRAKFVGFLVAQAGAKTLCAKDKEGNTPLHLAVEYKRCRRGQLEIIKAIAEKVEKCDGIIPKSSDDVFNKAGLSPYRHHLESCEKAEKEKKKKDEEKKKAKEEKEREKGGGHGRPDRYGPPVSDGGQRGAKAAPQKASATHLAPNGHKDPEYKPLSRTNTQMGPPLRTEALLGKDSATGKYGAWQLKVPNINSPIARPAPDLPRSRRGEEEKATRKDGSSKKKTDSKESSKDGHHSKVTEDNIKAIKRFLKLHYLREKEHDAAMDILYGRNTTSDQEINFNLSGYATMTQRRLKKWLSVLEFEEILQYVAIPIFSLEGRSNAANTKKVRGGVSKPDGDGRTDLVDVFQLLRDRGVNTILRVIVDDSVKPHSDQAIEDALRLDQMGVEIWDWKKADLCPQVIQRVAPNAREVHLYWSGNNTVLRGWSEEGGLKQLKELKKVYLHAQQGLETRARARQNVTEFRQRMKEPLRDIIVIEEGLEDLEVLRGTIDINTARTDTDRPEHPPKHEWIQCMKDFRQLLFEAEKEYKGNPGVDGIRIDEPIKVALIDDGIHFDELEYEPIGGRSFCRDEDRNLTFPWYMSSGGHGTVMASQIYRICPRTQLYVVKLEDYASESSNRQITARSAAQAIREAVRRKVHIISMSWTIDPPQDGKERRELENAILEAANKDILMFCSASDKGGKQTPTYPSKANPSKIFKIGAAEPSGVHDAWVGNLENIDFIFPGNKVESEGVNDATTKEVTYRTGSSVATALAAGLAALILYCVQVRVLRAPAGEEKEKARRDFQALKKHDEMMEAFKNIGTTQESKNKYITVWDVFGKKVTESENCERDKWIDLIAEVGTTLCMKVGRHG